MGAATDYNRRDYNDRMNLTLVDIGSNLTHDSFAGDRDAVMARAFEAGVRAQVVTGTDQVSSAQAAALAAAHPGVLWSTAGVHPHHAQSLAAGRALLGMSHLMIAPDVVAADPAVRAAVDAYLDAGGPLPPMTGIGRAEFEALAAGGA